MAAQQRIVRERRQYNQWVASQTLEDYALRYTAGSARKSSFRVGNTALGPIAFLACEAIGGTHHASPTVSRTRSGPSPPSSVLMFLIGLPIAYYAAKYGVDIDLLTRGAGFGYLGSTAHLADLRLIHLPAVLDRSQHPVGGAADAVRHSAGAGARHQLAGRHSDRASTASA